MNEQDVVRKFYNTIGKEERLADKHGQEEFQTTMKYIHDYIKPGMRVLEIGAGTGRYSLALAKHIQHKQSDNVIIVNPAVLGGVIDF